MKKLLILFLLIPFCISAMYGQTSFSGISGDFVTDSKPPEAELFSPNGGEVYYCNAPFPVTWSADDDTLGLLPVSIYLSVDGGNSYGLVASSLPDLDSATINCYEITNTARLKVVVQDTFGLEGFDESDALFSLEGFYVELKAFLEGPFAATEMQTQLNDLGILPLYQPYNAPPWNYTGTESVAAIPGSQVVDWVLVELREATEASAATPSTIVSQQAAFILDNGTIAAFDGSGLLKFGLEVNTSLFAVLWHRNHLGIMSAYPMSHYGNLYSYDFTNGENKVFGGCIGHKSIGSGIWGMIAGDGNPDGHINNADKVEVWSPQSGQSGYLPGDFDMNGEVNNPDKNDLWVENCAAGSQVPDHVKTCHVPE